MQRHKEAQGYCEIWRNILINSFKGTNIYNSGAKIVIQLSSKDRKDVFIGLFSRHSDSTTVSPPICFTSVRTSVCFVRNRFDLNKFRYVAPFLQFKKIYGSNYLEPQNYPEKICIYVVCLKGNIYVYIKKITNFHITLRFLFNLKITMQNWKREDNWKKFQEEIIFP